MTDVDILTFQALIMLGGMAAIMLVVWFSHQCK
jgi:hypothetical protein